jgi:hypothetical protein
MRRLPDGESVKATPPNPYLYRGEGTVMARGKPKRKPKGHPTKTQHESRRNLRLVPSSDALGDVFYEGWLAILVRGFGPSESDLTHERLLLGIAIPESVSPKVLPKVS